MSCESLLSTECLIAIAGTVTAVASAFIAARAFFVSHKLSEATQQHNRLSVKPRLTTWNEISAETCAITLRNIGVGPALIKSFQVQVDDKKIEGPGTQPIMKSVQILFPSNTPTITYSSYLAKGGALAVGSGITIVSLQLNNGMTTASPEFEHFFRRAKLVIEYQSIYEDETFTYDSYKDHSDAP